MPGPGLKSLRARTTLWITPIFHQNLPTRFAEDPKFEIHQGEYILESKTGGQWMSTRPVPLDQKGDFKIELVARKISGTDEYGYGLVWGAKDLHNFYIFDIRGNGSYSFEKITNDTFTKAFEDVGPMVNKFNSTNKLSLKKTGDSLEFFINDRLINRSPFLPFMGNYIGCIIFPVRTRFKWLSAI